MNADTPTPLVRNELAVAWDTIVAPRAAFAAVREHPKWLMAYLITCVLGTTGSLLQTPAGVHIAQSQVQRMIATDPNLSGMSAERQQAVLAQAVGIQHYIWIAYPLIVLVGIAITAVLLLIARAAGRGDAGFSRLFSLSAHVAIVSFGLAYFYIGIIVALKGGVSFETQADLLGTLPSLAWFAPGAGAKLTAFLASFSIFAIWTAFLLTLGLEIVARVSRGVAVATAVVLLAISASVAALTSR